MMHTFYPHENLGLVLVSLTVSDSVYVYTIYTLEAEFEGQL